MCVYTYVRTYAAYECCVVAKESTINWGCCGRVINDYSGLWRNKHIVAVLYLKDVLFM